MRRKPIRRRLWAWVPAAAFIAASLATAGGLSVISPAGAANPETVTVTAVVGSSITLSQSCAGGTDLGALTSGGSAAFTGADCNMTFATNDPDGAYLTVIDANEAADNHPSMCRIDNGEAVAPAPDRTICTLGTATDAIGDVALVGALGVDEFGISLRSVDTTDTTASWTASGVLAPATTDTWYPVSDTASTACTGAAQTTGSVCSFRFGAYPGNPQAAGRYQAGVTFQAYAT